MCSVRHRPIAFGAQLDRLGGVVRRVGICPHAERAQLVAPREHRLKLLGDLRLDQRHVLERDRARGCRRSRSARRRAERARRCAPRPRPQSTCTALAPVTAGRPIPRATSAAWLALPPSLVRIPLRGVKAGDVVGLGERAHEDHVAPLTRRAHRICARSARSPPWPRPATLQRRRRSPRSRRWGRTSDAAARPAWSDRSSHRRTAIEQALGHGVHREAHRRLRRALGAARLQHVQPPVLRP